MLVNKELLKGFLDTLGSLSIGWLTGDIWLHTNLDILPKVIDTYAIIYIYLQVRNLMWKVNE